MAQDLISKFKKLIKGEVEYKSANLGCNLLITRLKRKYEAHQTPAELDICLQEMNTFFEKYRSVMAKDIEAISIL
jgi:hypothetical protein